VGHRSGAARASVIVVLEAAPCCLSAQEVVERAHERAHPVGVASSYRVLERLHSLELVRRIDLGDGVARYEAVNPGEHRHHHLVCIECGRIEPFEDARLERALHATTPPPGFSLIDHEVVMRVRCAVCGRDR